MITSAPLFIDITVSVYSKKFQDSSSVEMAEPQGDAVSALAELSKDLRQKLVNKDYSDCTIICEDVRLPANKYILCLRSDVFKVNMSLKRQTQFSKTDLFS
jgi:hypothetical protein